MIYALLIRLILALTVMVAPTGASLAAAIDDAMRCMIKHGNGKIKLDQQSMNACTRAIDSGDLSNDDLALAYVNRAAKRQIKGDLNLAIFDLSTAIRLKPFYIDAISARRGV